MILGMLDSALISLGPPTVIDPIHARIFRREDHPIQDLKVWMLPPLQLLTG